MKFFHLYEYRAIFLLLLDEFTFSIPLKTRLYFSLWTNIHRCYVLRKYSKYEIVRCEVKLERVDRCEIAAFRCARDTAKPDTSEKSKTAVSLDDKRPFPQHTSGKRTKFLPGALANGASAHLLLPLAIIYCFFGCRFDRPALIYIYERDRLIAG